MNITKNIITDLFPLYAMNECSPDTRALVEEYLQNNPAEAEELRRVVNTAFRAVPLPPGGLDEARAFREARRRIRRRSWLMAFAIFFSFAPFSYFSNDHKTWWMLRDAPQSALIYGVAAVILWIAYAMERRRSRTL